MTELSECARPSLVGRRILVTGAAGGGIGSALVTTFAAAGAVVYANGRATSGLEEFVEDLGAGPEVVPMCFDVADDEQVVAALGDGALGIDTVVCNAAPSFRRCSIDEYPAAQWASELGTILTGSFNVIRATAGSMMREGFGRIVLVSSSAADRGTWGRGVGYAAAKAGLHGLARQLGLELGPHGVTVNCVAPSQIDTPRVRRGGRRTEASLAAYARDAVPVGRVGRPDDVVSAVRFLIDRGSSYITGQIVHVDGGSALASRRTEEVEPDGNSLLPPTVRGAVR